MKAPTISLGSNYRAVYRQVPYDNRYVFIEHGEKGGNWKQVAQIPASLFGLEWFRPMLKDDWEANLSRMERFHERVEEYDAFLDAQDAAPVKKAAASRKMR